MRQTGFPLAVRAQIIERSGGCCEVCGQAKPGMQVHHRRPRKMGGSRLPDTNTASNGIFVCADDHTLIESARMWALLQGLLLRQNQHPAKEPVNLHRGRVLLDDEGGATAA